MKTADCGTTYHIDRTWTAKDCAGNSSSCVQHIKVVDTKAPSITCKPGRTIECTATPVFDDPTATDNCDATPKIVVVSTSADGLTRTWQAVDACGNKSATCSQTLTRLSCAHIFPTQTTCCNFVTGTVTQLINLCYKHSGGKVSVVTPGVFFYFAEVKAPSSTFTVDILQTNNNAGFKYFRIQQGSQINVYTKNCGSVAATVSEFSPGQGRAIVTGAVAGQTYIIQVKYDSKSIETISTFTGSAPTVAYTFVSSIGGSPVSGSTGNINLKPNCSDNTPLPGSCTLPATTVAQAKAISTNSITDLSVTAFPNPYNDAVTFNFVSPKSGKAALVVYDIVGRKLAIVYQGNVSAGVPMTLKYKVPVSSRAPIVYKLSVGNQSVRGKLLPGDRNSNYKP